MIIAKKCPIEENGQIGFRLCSDQKTIILMCDECDTVWFDPLTLDAEHGFILDPPHFMIPTKACSIKKPDSRWATREEVAGYGWEPYITGEGKALDE